jgi:hypothetical protein
MKASAERKKGRLQGNAATRIAGKAVLPGRGVA